VVNPFRRKLGPAERRRSLSRLISSMAGLTEGIGLLDHLARNANRKKKPAKVIDGPRPQRKQKIYLSRRPERQQRNDQLDG